MRILIVRPGALGDTLLAFPIIRTLRTYYSHVHVTLVASSSVLPLALASGLVEEAYDYGDARWSELFSSFGIQNPVTNDLLTEIDMAVCWLRDLDGIVERNLHTIGIPQIIIAPGRPDEDTHMHIIEYLAHTVGIAVPEKFLFALDQKHPIASVSPIAIHPGSGGARKCWPVSGFATIIRALWQRGISVLLLAGPADHERLHTLLDQLGAPPRSVLLKTQVDLPLRELAHELQACRGYLGNDSGITHLAAMLGLPTIALFGPSDPLIWRPWGPSVYVIHHPDIGNLHVDEVMSNMEALLLDQEKA